MAPRKAKAVIEIVEETEFVEVESMEEIKNSYNSFIEQGKHRSSEISDIITESELNEIRGIIVDFKGRIEQYGVKKEPTTTERTLQRLAMIPLIGGFIESKVQDYKTSVENNKNMHEVLQDMFNVFKDKADYLEVIFGKAYEMKQNLLAQEIELEEFAMRIRTTLETTTSPLEKVAAIKLGALIEGNRLKTKEKIYNKLDFILKFIEEQLTSIALMIPGIEAGLVEDVAITAFLNNISDMNTMFSSLTELSNTVGRISAETVHGLITEVSESFDNGIDIAHIEKMAARNTQFMNKMVATTKSRIQKDATTYNRLTQISADMTGSLLAYQESNERVLIESTIVISPAKNEKK